MSNYREETYKHMDLVKQSLSDITLEIVIRKDNHDLSKFSPEEQETYERVTPEFKNVKYGTPEYEQVKAKLGSALEHHYQVNDHHPEHFPNGISDMNLMQITEMAADWYAAIRRDPNAHLEESLEKLRIKYQIEPQLFAIISNTIHWLRNGGNLSPRNRSANHQDT